MWLFLALVGIPILEIALFIEVGGALGLWPTLGIVIATALAGTVLLRGEGLAAMSGLQRDLEAGRDPTGALANGALIVVAGIVLLTPGFFTDTVGLALLVPPVRRAVIAYLARRLPTMVVRTARQPHRPHPTEAETVEGEFRDISDAYEDDRTGRG